MPETTTRDDIRRFQLHLALEKVSITTRNVVMSGVKFLFRVTLRRLDLAEEIYLLNEPQRVPVILSVNEVKRLLAVARCEGCDHPVIAFNSCRDRHCPKCQGAAARKWLADREAELLPVGYFHLVFTLLKPIADIAYQNKRVIFDLLFKASAEAVPTIAADPKHLGAKVGFTSVLRSAISCLGACPTPDVQNVLTNALYRRPTNLHES